MGGRPSFASSMQKGPDSDSNMRGSVSSESLIPRSRSCCQSDLAVSIPELVMLGIFLFAILVAKPLLKKDEAEKYFVIVARAPLMRFEQLSYAVAAQVLIHERILVEQQIVDASAHRRAEPIVNDG